VKRLLTLALCVGLLLPVWPQRAAAEGPMPLSAYPRPANDNGTGIHWAPTLFGQPTDMVEHYLAESKAMDFTWVKLIQGDAPKLEHEYLIRRLVENGIMPVLRVYRPWNEPYEHLAELVRLGLPAGVHYYELYNEPNLAGQSGGWRPGESISVQRLVDLWIPSAEAVAQAGGLPGLPALAPGGDYDDLLFLRDFLRELKGRGRLDLLYNAWLPLHNYFLNHPIDYPYDEVNLSSTPLAQEEIARRGLTTEQVEAINLARRNSRLPRDQGGYYVGDTIYADSNGFLKFQAYAAILEQECGFIVPIITTEGGAIVGSAEDPRYPAVGEADLVERTVAAFDYMRTQAPPYYFAFMPWLLANRAGGSLEAAWEGAAWYKEDGTTLPVVAALKDDNETFGHSLPQSLSAAETTPVAQPTPMATATQAGRRQSFQAPDLAELSQVSTPADSRYPHASLPKSASPTSRPREMAVLVVGNESAEVWLLPELGGRIVRLNDKRSGSDPLPLPAELSLRRLSDNAYFVDGGLSWLYPSPANPLVDAEAWQVDSAGPGTARLSFYEPRSRTGLSLSITVSESGSVAIELTANNPNDESRLVELGVASPAGSLFMPDAPARVSLAPGGSHTWRLVPSNSPPATDPQPTVTPSGKPVALVTPVPAMTPTPGVPQAATPVLPATPGVPTPAAPEEPTANGLNWDPRLDDLGISLIARPSARWRLVVAQYEDETQSGGQHHIFVRLLDREGRPLAESEESAWVAWPDGRQSLTAKDASAGFYADFPMYAVLGNYSVGVGGDSDTLQGLGLPSKHHVNYRLTFQRQS